jgi:hypothetical protein
MKSSVTLFTIPFIIGCVLLLGVFEWAKPTQSYILQKNELPEVTIKKAPKSPLEIISTKLDEVTNEKPEIELVVKNKTSLPIIAYAVRYDTFGKSFKAGGSILVNAPSIHKALQPEEETTQTIGFNISYSEPIKNIDLYVDYVQLADGSVWGPDNSKASETLAGERAGATLFINQVNTLLRNRGIKTALSVINQDESDLTPPSDASAHFIQGFRTGIGIVKDRLKQAFNKNGIGEMQTELNKSFDASADRR